MPRNDRAFTPQVAVSSTGWTVTRGGVVHQHSREYNLDPSRQGPNINCTDARSQPCCNVSVLPSKAEAALLTQRRENATERMTFEESDQQGAPSRAHLLPCVLPQTSKSFRGAFFSPFVRAYAPGLDAYGISQSDFLTFVDGLNEVFIAHPIFQGLGTAGMVMSMAYGVHPVQWAGMGLQFASGAASAATSISRTKRYLAAANKGLFQPAGLHAKIMTTKKMVLEIGYPEEKLRFLPSEMRRDAADPSTGEGSGESFTPTGGPDPRMKRFDALQGYVMPVVLDVPNATQSDSLLSKMSAAQVKRQDAKQQEKLSKNRREGDKKYMEKMEDGDKEMKKSNGEIMELEKKLAKEYARYQSKAAKAAGDSTRASSALQDYRQKEEELLRDIEEAGEKRDKRVGKVTREAQKERDEVERQEEKIANNVRWIVISKWREQSTAEDSMEDDEDASL